MATSGKRRARAPKELQRDLDLAGRELSTVTVMFHTAIAEKLGLSATELKTLDLLQRFGPLTAGELGGRTGLAPASVTGLVDRLERKRYARRIADPTDGRRVLIELNHESVGAAAALFSDFMRRLQELYAGYSVAQLETILHFLRAAAQQQQQQATAKLTGE